jgi:peptidoglycan/LPS O-acetylase OafA/YrhL
LTEFLIDRVIRLYPQYFFYIVLSLSVGTLLGLDNTYFHVQCSAAGYLLNLTPIPLNYWESFGTDAFNHCMLVSQAWTVGLELQVYVLLWLVLVSNQRLAAFVISAGVFIFGFAHGYSNKWAIYIYAPTTLFMFIAGSALMVPKPGGVRMVVATWAASLAALAFVFLYPERGPFLGRELLWGLVLGIPAVALASRMRPSRLDAALGSMSYGVYLNHLLIILALRKLAIFVPYGAAETIASVILACAMARLSYVAIEASITRWRRSRRNQPSAVVTAELISDRI